MLFLLLLLESIGEVTVGLPLFEPVLPFDLVVQVDLRY